MKATVVFVPKGKRRGVIRVDDRKYYLVESRESGGFERLDTLSGDLHTNQESWLYNLTRDTLVSIKVLGSYRSASRAVKATTEPESRTAKVFSWRPFRSKR